MNTIYPSDLDFCRVGESPTTSALLVQTWQATYPPGAQHSQCDFLLGFAPDAPGATCKASSQSIRSRLPMSVSVTPADMHDTRSAHGAFWSHGNTSCHAGSKIWADAAYRGQELADWCQAEGNWELEVVERTPGVRGFAVRTVTLDRGTCLRLAFAEPPRQSRTMSARCRRAKR